MTHVLDSLIGTLNVQAQAEQQVLVKNCLSKHCVLRMRAHTSWTVDRASQKVRENSKFSSPDSDHHYNVQRLCFRKVGNDLMYP